MQAASRTRESRNPLTLATRGCDMRWLTVLAALLGLVVMGSIATAPAVAQSQQDLDSPKADPEHHKVVFENDQVRVIRYFIAPHDKTVMHNHPSRVNILLTDVNAKFTSPDNKTADIHGKAGSVAWQGPIVHMAENVGDTPIEGIFVEPKNPHSARPAGTADETTFPGSVAKVEFENDQVRVVRYRIAPGQTSPMHGHPDNVQIVLSDTKANVTTADGKTNPVQVKAGQVVWRPALQHSVQNTGDKAFEGILVEMKGSPSAASK